MLSSGGVSIGANVDGIDSFKGSPCECSSRHRVGGRGCPAGGEVDVVFGH